MSWLLKLSNWLSGGALDRYREQTELAKAKLKQAESTIEELKTNNKQIQRELAQTQAQLQINRGFQLELGDAQIRLRQLETELEVCQQQLLSSEQQLQQSNNQLQTQTVQLNQSQNWLEKLKDPIEIVKIAKILPKGDFDSLWGFGLNYPQAQTAINTGAIIIRGWVLGKKATATKIRVIYQEHLLSEIPVNLPSPMITQQYPDIPNAGNSGFESCLAVTGIPLEHELKLQVLLDDESVIPLCAIFFT
ncbi:MAG: hypothetical protein ACFCU5_10845 [Pleurocapsa sp.]